MEVNMSLLIKEWSDTAIYITGLTQPPTGLGSMTTTPRVGEFCKILYCMIKLTMKIIKVHVSSLASMYETKHIFKQIT